MPDYAIRVTHPYERIASMVSAWAQRSETLVVYEHPADDKVKRTHCHMIVTGTNVDKKQLRNIGSKFVDLKGNENCSFKEYDGDDKAYVYMTKGVHDPKYLLCVPKVTADSWKARWTPPTKHEKVDKWTKVYNEFVMSQGYEIEQETQNKLYVLKKCAKYYVRVVLGMPLSVNACNIYKMIARTYCYDNDISIPSGDKLDW